MKPRHTTPSLNPFIILKDMPQRLSWKHIELDKEYDIEFIMPMKAMLQDSSRMGVYLVMCAEVKKTVTFETCEVPSGTMLVMDFAMKTFHRELCATPLSLRASINDDDNVRITFIKTSRQAIKFTKYERLESTDEHKQFAAKVYGNKEKYINQYDD